MWDTGVEDQSQEEVDSHFHLHELCIRLQSSPATDRDRHVKSLPARGQSIWRVRRRVSELN